MPPGRSRRRPVHATAGKDLSGLALFRNLRGHRFGRPTGLKGGGCPPSFNSVSGLLNDHVVKACASSRHGVECVGEDSHAL